MLHQKVDIKEYLVENKKHTTQETFSIRIDSHRLTCVSIWKNTKFNDFFLIKNEKYRYLKN